MDEKKQLDKAQRQFEEYKVYWTYLFVYGSINLVRAWDIEHT